MTKITTNVSENQQHTYNRNAFKIDLKKGVTLTEQNKKTLKSSLGCYYSSLHKKYICPLDKKESTTHYLSKQKIDANLIEIHDIDILKPKKIRDLILKVQRLEESYQSESRELIVKINQYNNTLTLDDFITEPIKNDKTETEFLVDLSLYEKALKLQEKNEEINQLRASIERFESEEKNSVKNENLSTSISGLTILGLNYNMEVLFCYKGKILKWPVERIAEARIKALFGKDAGSWQELRDDIIYQAHNKGIINDETPIKRGIWKLNNQWIIISGKHAGVFKNNTFIEYFEPVIDGKLIEFDDEDWMDWGTFKEGFHSTESYDLGKLFNEIYRIVQSWNWLDPTMGEYATAFIFLSPFQQSLSWRPWIYLTGQKGTGKSTFFDNIILAIYGALAFRLDKSTAHATAQTIGNTGLIPIFDEFEKYKHVPDILELAKLFNKGGKKTTGTPGANAYVFSLHHLAWFGSIYLPRQLGDDAAQESRMVKLELRKLNNNTPLLEKIDDLDGKKLGAKIIAAMLRNWDAIEGAAKEINMNRKKIIEENGVEIRTVENFMYASALLNLVNPQRDKYTVPNWAINKVIDDGDKIINTILSSIIKIGVDTYTVHEFLEKSYKDQDNAFFSKELTKVGLKFTSKDGIKYLALKCDTVSRYLLKDTDFREYDIQAPLGRIEGARPSEQVKGLNRCVLVPISRLGFE